jgi:hypothetical protein
MDTVRSSETSVNFYKLKGATFQKIVGLLFIVLIPGSGKWFFCTPQLPDRL